MGAVAWGSPECEAQVAKAPSDAEAWRCFYLWARREGRWAEASARYERAIEEDAANAHAMINLGHVIAATGGSAADWYGRALVAYEAQTDLSGLVKTHVAIAQMMTYSGEPAEMVFGHLDAADAAAQASGDGLLQAIAYAQRARRLWRDGSDYGEAYRLIRLAEKHAFPDGPYQLRLVVQHVLAGVCQETGRLDEASVASHRMVELTVEAGDRYVEATARLNVAAFALSNPDHAPPGTAETQSALAVQLAEELGNVWTIASSQCVRAEALEAVGGESLPYWLACREQHLALEEPGMAIMGSMGAAAAIVGDQPERALELAAESVASAAQVGDVWAEVFARFVEAALLWEVRGPEVGIAAFADHEAASTRLLAGQSGADTRAAVLSNQVDGQYLRAARLAQLGGHHFDGAIAAIEQLRARELHSALLAGNVFPEPTGQVAQRLAEIGQQVTDLNARLGAETDAAAHQKLSLEREALVGEEARLRDGLLDHHRTVQAPTVAQIQAELGEGELMVVFQTPPMVTQYPKLGAQPWVLAISQDAVGMAPLSARRSLDSLVLTFAGLYQDEGSGAAARERAGTAVFQQVLAPALASVGVTDLPERIILVPDGPLHGLPFAALYVNGAPLGSEVRLSRGASLSTWLSQRQSTARATGAPLVLGAPAWPLAGGKALPDLPMAAREARRVARLLGVDAQLGADAQEAVVHAGRTSPPALLHVAAHGLEDADALRRHALVLAEGGGHDGLLEAREVRLLDLGGAVVVLSACRGASGQVRDGDGLDGLSRAFLLAGSPVVVGSLWPVRDDAAGAFLADFTEALSVGETVDGALTEARRRRQEAGDPASAWAGMVAIGDGRRTLPAALQDRGCGGQMGLLAVFGGLFGLGRRRRQRASAERPR